MKNVYDVLLNFKKYAYEFYEWDRGDDVSHVKVIPSFKVDDKVLNDFLKTNFTVSDSFLKKIENKTEVFKNRVIVKIEYACIFFNDYVSLAAQFDKEGNVIGKSKMLFDEADDVISSGYDLCLTSVPYKVKNSYNNDNYTRKERNLIMILQRYLDMIFNKKEVDEIKYMYFECFNAEEPDVDKAYKTLKANVISGNFDVINKIKGLIKVLKK